MPARFHAGQIFGVMKGSLCCVFLSNCHTINFCNFCKFLTQCYTYIWFFILTGLDIEEHGEAAYPVSAYKDKALIDHLTELLDEIADPKSTKKKNMTKKQAIGKDTSVITICKGFLGKATPLK